MVRLSLVTLAFSAIGFASAQSGLWGQCGGQGWSGPTTCVAGATCVTYNPFYSQCVPSGTSTTSTSTTSSRTSTTSSTSSRTSSTSSSTRTSSTSTTRTSTTSSPSSTSTGVQIRGVSDPVYHLYLQSLSLSGTGIPVLGPEASAGTFLINGSIQLLSSPAKYLNIANNSTSYKALTFDSSPTFTGWALEGDTIITSTSSSYGRQLNFLACPTSQSGYYQLYLQTGSDTPSSSCTVQTIHLPCLC